MMRAFAAGMGAAFMAVLGGAAMLGLSYIILRNASTRLTEKIIGAAFRQARRG